MAINHFVQVEQEHEDGNKITVFHRAKPHFSIEIQPVYGPDGTPQSGVIKRIRIQNSWTRDYHQYSKLIAQAETLYRQTLNPEPLRF